MCRGCQAEIEYGTPGFAHLVVLAISAFLLFKVHGALPESISFIGWIVGGAALVGGEILLSKMYKDRVNFKRVYKTR